MANDLLKQFMSEANEAQENVQKKALQKAVQTTSSPTTSGKSKLDKKKKQQNKKATGAGVKTSAVGADTLNAAKDIAKTQEKKLPTKRNGSGKASVQKQETAKKVLQHLKEVSKPIVKTAENYDANPYTKEKTDAMWNRMATGDTASDKFGRVYAGVGQGVVDANLAIPNLIGKLATGKDVNLQERTGLNIDNEALKETAGFKGGKFAGEMIGYGMQNMAAAPAINGILANTKLGQMAAKSGTKMATNTRIGKLVGEEAAKDFTVGLARNAVEAGTVGLAQNIGIADQEGRTGLDLVGNVLLNTAADLTFGGLMEGVGLGVNAIKGAKALRKATGEIAEGVQTKTLPTGEEVPVNAEKVAVNPSENATEVAENSTKATARVKKAQKAEGRGFDFKIYEGEPHGEKYKIETHPGYLSGKHDVHSVYFENVPNEITRANMQELGMRYNKNDHSWRIGANKATKEEIAEAIAQDTAPWMRKHNEAAVENRKRLKDLTKTNAKSIEPVIGVSEIDSIKPNQSAVVNGVTVERSANGDWYNIKENGKIRSMSREGLEDYLSATEPANAVRKAPRTTERSNVIDARNKLMKAEMQYEEAYIKSPGDDFSSQEEQLSNLKDRLITAEKKRLPNGVDGRKLSNPSTVKLPKAESQLKGTGGRTLKPGGADLAREAETLKDARKKYGVFEGSDVPKATELGDVQQGARTIRNSDILDEEAVKHLEEGIRQGDYWKTTITNKSALNKAQDSINKSLDDATASFRSIMMDGRQAKSEDIARGYLLAQEYIKRKDYDMVENILADVSAMESEAGRTLQAMRIFSQLSPLGRMKGAKRTAEKLMAERGVDIKINQKLLDDIANATTDAEIARANEAFAVDVWNQVPATFSEKLNAWRYLAMLGNPKTHIRNFVGNLIGVPARQLSNTIAAGMEKAFKGKINKLSDGNVSGSKAVFAGKYKDLADEAYKKNKDALEAVHSKFNEYRRPSEAKLYKTKTLEGLRKGNAKALEWEDNIFKKGVFKKSFAQYCKANGLDLAKPVSDEFMEAATNYAHAQALKATYQDPNMLADAISKFKRKFEPSASDSAAIRIGKTVGHQVVESILPFVKTPANILKRGIEYSPAGVAGGIAKIASAKTAEDLMKGIEYFSQGITGTGLIGLGLLLGHRGIVNGSMGEYDKEYAYRQMLGEQDYAVTVGDYTYTLDWMSPLAMPFFVGVEASNVLDGSDDNTVWNVIESFTHLTEPVFEMSMLSGIETTFDTTFTSDSKVKTIIENSMQGYISQFVPTVFGQLARTLTPERKVALSTAETKTERNLDKYIDKLENKIPGVTEWNEPYVDQWGRTDGKKTSGDYWLSAAENFLSPGYVSKKNLTPVDKEVSRLYDKLGETDGANVIPAVSSTAYEQKFEGKEYRMSESEFTDYKKTVGSYRHTELQKLFKTEEYKTASDVDKAKMIKDVYDAGAEKGKEKFLVGSGKVTKEAYAYSVLNDTQKEAVDNRKITAVKLRALKDKAEAGGVKANGSGIAIALTLDGTSLKDMQAYSENVSETAYTEAQMLKKQGYTASSFTAEHEKAKAKYDASGNGSLNKEEAMAYLATTNYSPEKKWALLAAMTSVKKNPY